jgi:ubiquinone/menaquinone biosynthesis C-methylase UbiE
VPKLRKASGLTSLFLKKKNGSLMYEIWVRFKHALQSILKSEDKAIGLESEVRKKSVIDIGCGPNLDLNQNENPYKDADFYVGVDSSAPFIVSAFKRHGDDNHRFIRGSALELPFPDTTFQIATALFTLHHIPERPEIVISELVRVASEKVIIFDHIKARNLFKQFIQRSYWRIFDGGINYLTEEEWLNAFEQNGLTVEKMIKSGIFFNHVFKVVLTRSQPTHRQILQ